jgi:hypothetical protein
MGTAHRHSAKAASSLRMCGCQGVFCHVSVINVVGSFSCTTWRRMQTGMAVESSAEDRTGVYGENSSTGLQGQLGGELGGVLGGGQAAGQGRVLGGAQCRALGGG